MLSRNTEWRQGSIITQESFSILCPSTNQDTYAVIISHDCDLQNENEELVEIIMGSVVSKADSNFTHARHIRRLHLTYQTETQSENIMIELTHVKRQCVPKDSFFEAAKAAPFHLPCEEKRALKQWLSARYGRPAFPNAFEIRLKKDKKLEKKITRILSPANSQLIGVFF